MYKILIIEDDPMLSDEIKTLLTNNGYDVYQLFEFSHAVDKILEFDPDLLLLDILLPKSNGQYILRDLRKKSHMPVIMLTSKNTDMDEIMSRTFGADDYITKPYNPTLLLLRIESLLNRVYPNHHQDRIIFKDFTLNLLKSTIEYQGKELILSKNELNILYYLIQHHGQIVSREALMDYLWDVSDFVDDNTLTVNINRLRHKLASIGIEDFIQTRRKQGYLVE